VVASVIFLSAALFSLLSAVTLMSIFSVYVCRIVQVQMKANVNVNVNVNVKEVPSAKKKKNIARSVSETEMKMTRKNSNDNDNRDLFSRHELPPDLMLHICNYLTARDVTVISSVNQSSRQLIDGDDCNSGSSSDGSDGDEIWTLLWKRDYGNVLLEWDIGRQAFQRSLNHYHSKTQAQVGRGRSISLASSLSSSSSLEQQIQTVIFRHGGHGGGAKHFYFHFQQSFLNYILAGHNSPSLCLMGIHGHIFDFTDFAPSHPGLSDPIILEGGRDVTLWFEDHRHSTVARVLARKLCVLVDKSCMKNMNINNRMNRNSSTDKTDTSGTCGLCRIPQPASKQAKLERRKLLEKSNTTPPPMHDIRDVKLGLDAILPLATFSTPRRPLTLCNMREEYEHGKERAEAWASRYRHDKVKGKGASASTNKCGMRVYYDPFAGEWKGWYSDPHWNPIFCDIDFD